MERLFTLAEANALIPRLSRDFAALAQLRESGRQARDALTLLETKGRSNGKDLATKIRERQDQLTQIDVEANRIVENVVAIGCEIKDVDQGLVDFPSRRNDRTVYLCWKIGETTIGFWHELTTGYQGRQPL